MRSVYIWARKRQLFMYNGMYIERETCEGKTKIIWRIMKKEDGWKNEMYKSERNTKSLLDETQDYKKKKRCPPHLQFLEPSPKSSMIFFSFVNSIMKKLFHQSTSYLPLTMLKLNMKKYLKYLLNNYYQ